MTADLRLDEQMYREILQAVEESVVVLDRHGRIRYVNHLEEGYELQDVIGRGASDFIHPDYLAQHRSQLERILSEGVSEEFEVPGRGAPGERQWYAGRAAPIIRKGKTLGVVVVLKNITALRKAQKEAVHLKRLLPVCPWCSQKIRLDSDKWVAIEEYVYTSGEISVTHGMCPDCGPDGVEEI